MEETKVYRNGAMRIGYHSTSLRTVWEVYDAVKPVGHAGRLDSLYASPSLEGVVRWTHTKHMDTAIHPDTDLSTHSIHILNPENLYVYDINSYDSTYRNICQYWDHGVFTHQEIVQEIVQPYWQTAIRLTDWAKASVDQNLNPMDWEVLVPMESVSSYSPVPDHEIIEVAPESTKEDLRKALNDHREFAE